MRLTAYVIGLLYLGGFMLMYHCSMKCLKESEGFVLAKPCTTVISILLFLFIIILFAHICGYLFE